MSRTAEAAFAYRRRCFAYRREPKRDTPHYGRREWVRIHESIADDFEQWMEYVDPEGIMTEDEFDSMTVEERLEIIRECFEWAFQPDPHRKEGA